MGHGAYHGYWVWDHHRLHPRFGTEAELQHFRDQAQALGIELVLDIVNNHVGYDAPLLQSQPDWFHDAEIPARDVTRSRVHGLPDLNPNHAEVYEYLSSSAKRWGERVNPRGFRLDAVKHLPLSFWQRYNQEIKARRPQMFLLGEYLDGNAHTLARTLETAHFDAVFDFPLYYALTQSVCQRGDLRELAQVLSLDRIYPNPNRLVTFVDNHDLPRVVTACAEDPARVRAAYTLLFALRGVPSLTFGSAEGRTGNDAPETRAAVYPHDAQPFGPLLQTLIAFRRADPVLSHGRTVLLSAKSDQIVLARVHRGEARVIIYQPPRAAPLRLPPLLQKATQIWPPTSDMASGVRIWRMSLDASTPDDAPGFLQLRSARPNQ